MEAADKLQDGSADSAQPSFAPDLLPHEHAFSLSVAEQRDCLQEDLPRGVNACESAGPGLVLLTLRAGRADGYGARAWPLFVGGAGLGDEPELALMLGVPPRAPLAVRFAVPMAMSGVDDSGCCDATFWEEMGDAPTLRAIAQRAVAWLEGSHLSPAADGADGAAAVPDGSNGGGQRAGTEATEAAEEEREERAEARRRWEESERHWHGKHTVVATYRPLARSAALVAEQPTLLPEWLAPSLRPLVAARGAAARRAAAAAALDAGTLHELAPGIYSFDCFSASFCAELLAEIDAFEATELPRRRPNTMNRHGLILNEIGMEPLLTLLLRQIIAPLSAAVYPREEVARALDHHHSFVVAYQAAAGGDRGLDLHHDAAEVTLNACLGRDFEGATLRFCGRHGDADNRRSRLTYDHAVGRAVLHLGRQRHGADNIARGERVNLICWARSSSFRGAAAYGHIEPDGYPKAAEEGQPDRECLSLANDDDYAQQLRALGDETAASRAETGCATGACKRKLL